MKNITVISGGTATNHILEAFDAGENCKVNYILPVSDNGGSSSEIIRVLGGCAIGDIRSRLVRLIPEGEIVEKQKGIRGVKELLSYRLSKDCEKAKYEWSTIVDGSHFIWEKVENGLKVMLLSFLIHVDMEIHKRSKLGFKFELASVGNLFLTGCRLFFGDLDSGIEMICRVCRIDENIGVSGCLNTNFTYHIAAILENGEIIRGQSQISHPSNINNNTSINISSIGGFSSVEDLVSYRDRDLDCIHPSLENSQLHFNKDLDNVPPLHSLIKRVIYISPYGEEIHPRASRRTLESLRNSDVIVYSIGSLWTSIVPVLLLGGVGDIIVGKVKAARKVLLLNSEFDRETVGMRSGVDFVRVIVDAVLYSINGGEEGGCLRVGDVITDVVYCREGEVCIGADEADALGKEGVRIHGVCGGVMDVEGVRRVVCV